MKKARQVEIPEDGNLTLKDAYELQEHAVNSAIWYAGRSSKSTQQIRDKLYLKGFPRETVHAVAKDGSVHAFDFVEAAVDRLVELSFLDDEALARGLTSEKLRLGKGLQKIRNDLRVRGIPSSIIEEVLDDVEDSDQNEALEKAVRQVMNTSAFSRIADPRKRQEKLGRSLASKGFAFSDIIRVLEELDEGMG